MSASTYPTEDGGGFKVYGSLFKVDARYEFLNPLGKGSYGIVCAAKDRETGQRLAIKKVCPMAKRSSDAKHTLREVLLLQLLGKHPNIIAIHNLSTNVKDDELYIVMDLMDTDLHRVIQSSQALSESHVKYFLHQLLRGVKYLHDNGVLHRDLKPGNLLLTKTCQLKIADFGLARKIPKQHGSTGGSHSNGLAAERPRSAPAVSTASRSQERAPMTEHVVTRWYRAPELMLQPDGFYDESVDMWSIGCIFAEILGRKALFPGKNFLQQLTLIFDVLGTPPHEAAIKIKSSQAQRFLKSLGKRPRVPFSTLFPNASSDALDLLERLLEFDPEKRISAHEALQHPFMQPIEKKYKGVDPHPSARVDFSFDGNKKLTKLDLKSLILKEVDTFRRSVAHRAAVDADVEQEKMPSTTSEKIGLVGSGDAVKRAMQPPNAIDCMPQTKVMCGSAGMSMIHSTLRQRGEMDDAGDRTLDGTAPASGYRVTSDRPTSAAIGSSRARIRMATKPPVPKQPPIIPGGVVVDIQDHVRVVSVADSRALLAASQERDGVEQAHNDELASGATTANYPIPQPQQEPESKVTPSSLSNVSMASVSAAISALEQRSRVLMASSHVQAQWAAPLHARGADIVVVSDGRRGASASSPTSPAMSSSSSSSSDASGDLPQADHFPLLSGGSKTARAEVNMDATTAAIPRRRVASAGPIRVKPNLAIGFKQVTPTAGATAINNAKTPTHQTSFAGSATSLIRAHRSNNALSGAVDASGTSITTGREPQQPMREARDEVAPSLLKSQRSMTQLNQQEAAVARRPTKKLTVPKSPKFSVMSWQKKKESNMADPLAHAISRR